MTDFRPGDIVTVELEVVHHQGWRALAVEGTNFDKFPGPWTISAHVLGMLNDAGKVTLVRRAEPDWREGDIGKHVTTGALYVYTRARASWVTVAHPDPFEVGVFQGANTLAGKLVRCTVTPEVTS